MRQLKRIAWIVAVTLAASGLAGCWTTPSFPPPSRPLDPVRGPDAGARRFNVDWGNAQRQDTPPPPISGGTLLVTRDGHTAVAADPDRDVVHLVDLDARTVRQRVTLTRGDEPGRLVEDAGGRVHVALRRGGAVVTIELGTATVTARRVACPAPRGIAYDPGSDLVHVACAGGELVTLPAGAGGPVRVLHLARDLRDVVVQGGELLISTFRTPTLIHVAADGTVGAPPVELPYAGSPSTTLFTPRVAWRTVALPAAAGSGVVIAHQLAQIAPVRPVPGGYSVSSCSGSSIVQSAVTWVSAGTTTAMMPAALPIAFAVLPVDLAFVPDGSRFALVAPGNAASRTAPQLFIGTRSMLDTASSVPDCENLPSFVLPAGQAVAVAATPDANFVVQTREPAALLVYDGTTPLGAPIALATDSVRDSGHEVFHANAGGFVACASCHPEGDDDGFVWEFAGTGRRRTQSLRIGLLGTEPFHWEGDMASFPTLVHDVFSGRMNGGDLPPAHVDALAHWLDALPHPIPNAAADFASAVRGRAVFEDPTVGCTGCHGGPKLTNNQTTFVGTGAALQVPSLIGLGRRAPYMHDGCAPTLRDRFTNAACGGGDSHGHTSQLAPDQLADLIAYLDAL